MLFPYASSQAVLTTCSHTTQDLLGFATVLLSQLFYNRYLDMLPVLTSMYKSGCLIAKVFCNSFWMAHHGSKSPKRTTVWSTRKIVVAKLVPTSDGLVSEWIPTHNFTLPLAACVRTKEPWPRRPSKNDALWRPHACFLGFYVGLGEQVLLELSNRMGWL